MQEALERIKKASDEVIDRTKDSSVEGQVLAVHSIRQLGNAVSMEHLLNLSRDTEGLTEAEAKEAREYLQFQLEKLGNLPTI